MRGWREKTSGRGVSKEKGSTERKGRDGRCVRDAPASQGACHPPAAGTARTSVQALGEKSSAPLCALGFGGTVPAIRPTAGESAERAKGPAARASRPRLRAVASRGRIKRRGRCAVRSLEKKVGTYESLARRLRLDLDGAQLVGGERHDRREEGDEVRLDPEGLLLL